MWHSLQQATGQCSRGDGRDSTENPQCARWVQASDFVVSDNISLLKASHLTEAKVKEWAGHPAHSGKIVTWQGYRKQ